MTMTIRGDDRRKRMINHADERRPTTIALNLVPERSRSRRTKRACVKRMLVEPRVPSLGARGAAYFLGVISAGRYLEISRPTGT